MLSSRERASSLTRSLFSAIPPSSLRSPAPPPFLNSPPFPSPLPAVLSHTPPLPVFLLSDSGDTIFIVIAAQKFAYLHTAGSEASLT